MRKTLDVDGIIYRIYLAPGLRAMNAAGEVVGQDIVIAGDRVFVPEPMSTLELVNLIRAVLDDEPLRILISAHNKSIDSQV